MKVTVRDSAILKTIEPEELAAHLRASGWHEHGRVYNDAGAIWRLKNSSDGSELCTGDLIKDSNTFVLKNPRHFALDEALMD